MPILPFQILLGVLGVFFAHFFGRNIIRYWRGVGTRSRTFTWFLRTFVCMYAVVWFGGMTALAAVVLAAAALSLAGGAWDEWRPKRQEDDLTRTMFPQD